MSQYVIESNCAEAETAQCAICSHESLRQGQPNGAHSGNLQKLRAPANSPGPLSAGLLFLPVFPPKIPPKPTLPFSPSLFLMVVTHPLTALSDVRTTCVSVRKKGFSKSSSKWAPFADHGQTATEKRFFYFLWWQPNCGLWVRRLVWLLHLAHCCVTRARAHIKGPTPDRFHFPARIFFTSSVFTGRIVYIPGNSGNKR